VLGRLFSFRGRRIMTVLKAGMVGVYD